MHDKHETQGKMSTFSWKYVEYICSCKTWSSINIFIPGGGLILTLQLLMKYIVSCQFVLYSIYCLRLSVILLQLSCVIEF